MLTLKLDQDGDGKEYQAALRGRDVLPSGENVSVITTAKGTVGGQACVLVTFDVQMPGGTIRKAQYTFTQKELLAAADAVRAAHPLPEDLGKPEAPAGTIIRKFHDGVGWNALLVEKCYIITVEGRNEISLAFTDAEVEPVGRAAVDKVLGKI